MGNANLKFFEHFDLQNRKHFASLRTNMVPIQNHSRVGQLVWEVVRRWNRKREEERKEWKDSPWPG